VTDAGPDRADTYAAALASLSQVLVDAPTLRATLEELLAVAAIAAPEVTALTVTAITEDGDLTAAASTDAHARTVDELEYALAEGPCITALQTGEEQLVRDVHTDERWPRFNASAREEGFGSVAGLPLRAADGVVIGALDVFGAEVDGLTEHDLAVLRRVCPALAAVLANARAYRRTQQLSAELSASLEERAVVNRAIGVLIGRRGGEPDAARRSLDELARHRGDTVIEVAHRVLTGEETLGGQ
jgi:GAF domain-containing protein